uniref:Uncharacterized protein n=1 Tax=Anopheles atroparvus TaxID=41427 RepID=A0A182J9H2_ANOAO
MAGNNSNWVFHPVTRSAVVAVARFPNQRVHRQGKTYRYASEISPRNEHAANLNPKSSSQRHTSDSASFWEETSMRQRSGGAAKQRNARGHELPAKAELLNVCVVNRGSNPTFRGNGFASSTINDVTFATRGTPQQAPNAAGRPPSSSRRWLSDHNGLGGGLRIGQQDDKKDSIMDVKVTVAESAVASRSRKLQSWFRIRVAKRTRSNFRKSSSRSRPGDSRGAVSGGLIRRVELQCRVVGILRHQRRRSRDDSTAVQGNRRVSEDEIKLAATSVDDPRKLHESVKVHTVDESRVARPEVSRHEVRRGNGIS